MKWLQGISPALTAPPEHQHGAAAAAFPIIVACILLLSGCGAAEPEAPDPAPVTQSSVDSTASSGKVSQGSTSDAKSEDPASPSSVTGEFMFLSGNTATLKVDGPSTFRAMFEDIDGASDYVHIETYILRDDEIGRKLAQHLFKARDRGVKVRVLVDAFGSMDLSEDYVEQLEARGIEFQKFHPIDPSEDLRVWRSNNRDHRKLLVIDDKIAYTGGLNFSEVYKEGSSSVGRGKPVEKEAAAEDGAWRDTQVRISGPVVKQFQYYFLKMWNRDLSDEEQIVESQHLPEFDVQGDIDIAVVASSGGDDDEFDIYATFTTAIEESKRRVWITQAYFAPNEEFLEAIKAAAKRGVDTRLLLPGVSDASLIVQASRASYQDLLDSGVRIYERKASVLHAKTMVVDGVWSSVGSANFDYRSFVHNYELNAVLVSKDFGQSMEKLFQSDIKQSEEITLSAWNDRSLWQRFEEWLGDSFREWL